MGPIVHGVQWSGGRDLDWQGQLPHWHQIVQRLKYFALVRGLSSHTSTGGGRYSHTSTSWYQVTPMPSLVNLLPYQHWWRYTAIPDSHTSTSCQLKGLAITIRWQRYSHTNTCEGTPILAPVGKGLPILALVWETDPHQHQSSRDSHTITGEGTPILTPVGTQGLAHQHYCWCLLYCSIGWKLHAGLTLRRVQMNLGMSYRAIIFMFPSVYHIFRKQICFYEQCCGVGPEVKEKGGNLWQFCRSFQCRDNLCSDICQQL